ncbi:MAG TPA: hypothetical protein VHF88_06130 [Thermoleophilaceae bacterium]|nr:hypothetical protein [Thermoleophilaceae bacterium]
MGGTLSQAFSIYGSQAGVLIPLALALFLVVAVVNGLAAESVVLLPVGLAVSIIAGTLYTGMVVALVSDVQDGRRDYSVGELARSASHVILPLIGAGLLAGIGIGIGFLLLVIPGLFLMTIWAVIAPVIVLERVGVMKSFGRSRELVKGDGWRVFGVIVIVFIIVIVVRAILGAIAVGIDDSTVAQIIFDWIGSSLTAPISALVAAVIYFRLKGAKDGGAPVPAEPGPATV